MGDYIRKHYYEDHLHINPNGIVPIGPKVDYEKPNDRAEKFPANSVFKFAEGK